MEQQGQPRYVNPALVASGVMGLVRQARTCGNEECEAHQAVRTLVAGMFGDSALPLLALVSEQATG